MEKLNGKKAYVPKSFQEVQAYNGKLDFNPANYINSLLIKNLLYHSYGNECSLEDYSIELGIAIPYIEEFVYKLESKDFLIKKGNGKYLTNIAFIDKKERREILDYGRENIVNFYNAVIKYAKENFENYKSLLDDPTVKEEHLMWSLLCLIIVSVEEKFCNKYTKRKDGSRWDLMLQETVDKLYPDEFFVSCQGTLASIEGHEMAIYAFPSMHWNEDGGASDVIAYDRALTGEFNLDVLYDVLIKNKKFNDFNEETKAIITSYAEQGLFDVNENNIKVNIPVIAMENGRKLTKDIFEDANLFEAYKELYNGIYLKVRSLIPSYLEKQTAFIIQATFNTVRSLILSRAFNEGLIKNDDTRKVFVYNGIIYK